MRQTYKSSSLIAPLSEFFSASPSNNCRVPSNSHFDADPDEDNDDSISQSDNEVETMDEWFDDGQLDEPTHKRPSKFNKAMKVEVCSSSHSSFKF